MTSKENTKNSKKSDSDPNNIKVKGKISPVDERGSLKIGDQVPELTFSSNKGDVHLRSKEGSYAVLYFYPKDSTPGCTQEGLDFSELFLEFKNSGALVYGVSRDSVASHCRFSEKQNFLHQLISDPHEQLCSLFGVMKMKKLYGREYRGIDRSTFLIDPSGFFIKEWREVKVKGHAQEVLQYLLSLKKKQGEAE